MAIQVQLRSGTTAQTNAFTGAVGEVSVDTDKKTLVVHDGTTAGGTPLLKASQLVDSSETAKGVVELATQAEVNTGTDTTRVVTPATLAGTFQQQSKTALNATGSAPIYACRAWVNFNGTGTPTIRASGNVSSITDNGVGDYTVNFTTSISDTNYSWIGTVGGDAVGYARCLFQNTGDTMTTSALRVRTGQTSTGSSNPLDYDIVNLAVFR